MGINVIVLEGHLRSISEEDSPLSSSLLKTISTMATIHAVSSVSAKGMLTAEGIDAPITLIDSPVTHHVRRLRVEKSQSNNEKKILVCVNSPIRDSVISSVKQTAKRGEVIVFNPEGIYAGITEFYSTLKDSSFIVSDHFLFDQVAKDLNKQFFFVGTTPISTDNLGVTTYWIRPSSQVPQENMPQYHFEQYWGNVIPLQSEVSSYGLTSLLKFL